MGNGSGTVEVTNDGAIILRSVGVDNPAAKVPNCSRLAMNVELSSCNILLYMSAEETEFISELSENLTFRSWWRCLECRTARLGTGRPQ